MLHYEVDDYVQEPVTDDVANANCVASWRNFTVAEGGAQNLFVDLHNGWVFDSRQWHAPADAPGRILCALQTNERGRFGGMIR